MTEGPSKTNLHYGRALVNSGLAGLRRGRDSKLGGEGVSEVLARSALASLSFAAIGVCAGLFRFRRRSTSRTIAYALAGGAIGFAAGFTWKTRELAASMARSALKEMGTVRDERWIEKHPVNYG